MMSIRSYFFFSTFICGCMLLTVYWQYEEFYMVARFIAKNKAATAIVLNFIFSLFVSIGNLILWLFFEQLRLSEAEQIFDSCRTFLFEIVLFIILSDPTINGEQIETYHAVFYICFLMLLRASHVVFTVRQSYIFDIGIPRLSALIRGSIFIGFLFALDAELVFIFSKLANTQSSFYIWILYQSTGHLIDSLFAITKYVIQITDMRNEYGISKLPVIFYIDLVQEIVELTLFLVFLVVFISNYPTKLPLYMTADIVQAFHALYTRVKSFRRYRSILAKLDQYLSDPDLDELDKFDCCIICRDFLKEGAKKLKCGHIFHLNCLKSWLIQSQTCPTCRHQLDRYISNPETHAGIFDDMIEPAQIEVVQDVEQQRGDENHNPSSASNNPPMNNKQIETQTPASNAASSDTTPLTLIQNLIAAELGEVSAENVDGKSSNPADGDASPMTLNPLIYSLLKTIRAQRKKETAYRMMNLYMTHSLLWQREAVQLQSEAMQGVNLQPVSNEATIPLVNLTENMTVNMDTQYSLYVLCPRSTLQSNLN